MSSRKRGVAILVGACLLAVLATAPVMAAAPSNDDIATPIVIGSIPYSNAQDTTEATTGTTDPDCDGAGPTVWYQYTAAESGSLEANTFGSDYDTTLYVGTPDGSGGMELIDCNDDAGLGVQSRLRFEAEEGVTYLFMVGSFSGRDGGSLVFNLDIAPPVVPVELSLGVDAVGHFDRSGVATVSGNAVCSGAEFVALFVALDQRVGRFIVRGDGWAWLECDSAGAAWTVEVWPHNGTFAGGPANTHVEAFACNADDCSFESVVTTIRLRR